MKTNMIMQAGDFPVTLWLYHSADNDHHTIFINGHASMTSIEVYRETV